MRHGLLALPLMGAPLVVVAPRSAHADPAELGAFTGVTYFGDSSGLGDSPVSEHGPETSLAFGGRLGILPGHQTDNPIRFGGELELSYVPSNTVGTTKAGMRRSVDTPILAYRAFAMLRLARNKWFHPHIELGFGADSLVTSSDFTSRDTDVVLAGGVGATVTMSKRIRLRIDLRQTWAEERANAGWGAGYEVQAGLVATFGTARSHDAIFISPPSQPDPDQDGDSITDAKDKCPTLAENMNGVEDSDGCPETDDDGDGLVGPVDKCPDQPEDKDQFQDEDGCPDLDDDADGIADKDDKCPLAPETKNGLDDTDGCPDELPANMMAAFTAAKTITFEAKSSRLSKTDKEALDKTASMLMTKPKLKIIVTVRPAAADAAAKETAGKRADQIKWYLGEQGAGATQVQTSIGAPAEANAPIVELSIGN